MVGVSHEACIIKGDTMVTKESQRTANIMDLEAFLMSGAKAPAARGRSVIGVQRSIEQAGEQ